MQYIGIGATAITAIIVSSIFTYMWKKRKVNDGTNVIKWQKMFMYIGICGLIFIDVIIPILFLLELDPTLTWYEGLAYWLILAIPSTPVGIYLILLVINWRVEVLDNGVIYHNIFNKKYYIDYKDVEVKQFSATVRILKPYLNKKGKKKNKLIVNISYYCNNYEMLITKYREYKKQNNKTL